LHEATEEYAHLLAETRAALQRREAPVRLAATPSQWDTIDEVFGTIKASASSPQFAGFVPSIHRGAVVALRIAMTLRVLRSDVGTLESAESLVLGDDDVGAALLFTSVLLDHALRVFEALPQSATPIDMSRAQDEFFDALPGEFQRRDAVEIGAEMGIARRTVGKYLRRLVEAGRIYRVVGKNGLYRTSKDGFSRAPILID
jgi:hypothetical protein